jgi:hypothetical protein
LDVPATGFALDIDLAHKAAGKAKKKESFRILLNCASDKKSIELVKMACRLRCSNVVVELCFEKISDLKTFAKEKKFDLVVEVEKDFKKARVTDVSRNIETVKKIKDLIKEF